MIILTGELMPNEIPENRTILVDAIWQTMDDLSIAKDIRHFNALLKVYLENEHTFNPIGLLKSINADGVQPDNETYRLVLHYYCQRGDMEMVNGILETMKQIQYPVDLQILNSLILGYSRTRYIRFDSN